MLARRLLRFAALMAALEPCGAMAQGATEVFDSAAPSVVVVQALGAGEKKSAQGSAVVIGPEEVVTNCHVIEDASRLLVRHRGRDYPAVRKHSDPERDICSLAVAGLTANAAVRGSTRSLKVGQKVFAIGAPQGLELTLSEGIISGLRDLGSAGRVLQTTAPISPGSSGGGLFDEQGRLIGLTTFYLSEGQQLNFAVPVEWISELPKRAVRGDATAKSRDTWLLRTIELEERKDWRALRDHALAWTRAQPKNPAAWFALGIAYNALRQHAKAIDAYQQALRIDPQNADAWYDLGIAYYYLRQHAKAIDAYQQALRIDPQDAGAWNNLGNAYSDVNQHAKAIDAYQQALRIDPQDAVAWYNLGNAYRALNQHAKAIDAYQQALRIDPQNAGAWNNLGNAYSDVNQHAKAIDAYQQALRIDPQDAEAWFNLGLVYRIQGQRGKVTEIYERLKELDRDLAERFFTKIVLP